KHSEFAVTLFRRPEGATTYQPRATPWELLHIALGNLQGRHNLDVSPFQGSNFHRTLAFPTAPRSPAPVASRSSATPLLDHLLADFPLPAQRLDKRHVGTLAPILPHCEINADLIIAKLTRAHLVRIGASLDGQSALKLARVVERQGQ